MKRITFKSVLSIVLCSIVAMLAISCSKDIVQENEFETIEFYAKEGQLPRWQEQLQWISDTFEDVFPDLKLVGWRSIGSLNSQTEIEKFIDDGLQDNKMFGHTIDVENKIYVVAPRSELMQKYGVWSDEAINPLKNDYNAIIPIGANIIELKWIYKGKEYFEKIAVSNEIDALGSAIKFSTISQFILVKDKYFTLNDWQINDKKQSELKAKIISPEVIKQLEIVLETNKTRTGIDGEEEVFEYLTYYEHHQARSDTYVGGVPTYDILMHTVTQFSKHDLIFRGWGKVIERCNAAPNYCCDVDATLIGGEVGISTGISYKWGYAHGYGSNSASVGVDGIYLNIYGSGASFVVSVVCEQE